MPVPHVQRIRDSGMFALPHVLILVGFGVIGVGAVLPWVDKELPVKVYILGMESGLERIWVRRLLVLASIGVLVDIGRFLISDWRPILDFALLVIGGLIAAITLSTSPFTSRWTSAVGVYITLGGSLLVMLSSIMSIVATQVTMEGKTNLAFMD